MDYIDRDDMQWKIALLYFIPSLGFILWWFFGQILIASGQIITIPDPNADMWRLILGALTLIIGVLRLRWKDMRYPNV